jgi:hypothetical protein
VVRYNLSVGLALLTVLVWLSGAMAAEQEKTEKEKRREAEAAEEERLDPEDSRRNPLIRGKVVLFGAVNPEDPDVIGLLEAENRRYKLEAAGEEIKTKLLKTNNQVVALRGKIRDQGTTLIVEGIEGGGPPPGLVRNPDGL